MSAGFLVGLSIGRLWREIPGYLRFWKAETIVLSHPHVSFLNRDLEPLRAPLSYTFSQTCFLAFSLSGVSFWWWAFASIFRWFSLVSWWVLERFNNFELLPSFFFRKSPGATLNSVWVFGPQNWCELRVWTREREPSGYEILRGIFFPLPPSIQAEADCSFQHRGVFHYFFSEGVALCYLSLV